MTNPPHSSDCFRNYIIRYSEQRNHQYLMATWSTRWNCPACAVKRLSDLCDHLVAHNETLCWGMHSRNKAVNAKRHNIGWFKVTYDDSPSVMVAGSHLYEPPMLSQIVVQQIIDYSSDKTVSRIGWSEGWRPLPKDNPYNYQVINCDTGDYERVKEIMRKIGIDDGTLGGMSSSELKDRLGQHLKGVTWKPSK